MNRSNSGQIRIIEAFFAAAIVFSSLAVSSTVTVSQNMTRNQDLARVGLQALMELDADGTLGTFLDGQNSTALRKALSQALPPDVCFNLTVYDAQMQSVGMESVSNGGFSSQNVAFVEYACASRSSIFHSYIVHLRLAAAS